MNMLQKLLAEKLAEGKSYRRMEEECGVSHNSLSDYHQKGKIPHHGKNLALLARYFNVGIESLLDTVHDSSVSGFGSTLEDQLAYREWQTLSPDQKLEAVQLLRKLKASG